MDSLAQSHSASYLTLNPNLSTAPYLIFAPPSSSLSFCSSASFSSPRLCFSEKLSGRSLGKSLPLIVKAKSKDHKDKEDSHSSVPKPDESTWFFPEAVLLKEKKLREDGRLLPDFADAEEEQLYEALMLEMETGLNVEEMRHYEVVYLIHEKHEEEVGDVNEKIQDFMREKKGVVWRFNDWGMRRLAYKIKKAKHAHYFLMNFEVDAKWINDFKSLLEQDERVIRYLVTKKDDAETQDYPPPPDFYSMRGYGDDDDDEEDDYYIEYDEEDGEWEEGEEGDDEYVEGDDDAEEEGEGGGETDDVEGDDAKEATVVKSNTVRQPLRKLQTEKVGR